MIPHYLPILIGLRPTVDDEIPFKNVEVKVVGDIPFYTDWNLDGLRVC